MRSELLLKERTEDQLNLGLRANASSVSTVIENTTVSTLSSTARRYIAAHFPMANESPDVLGRELETPLNLMRRNPDRTDMGPVSDLTFKNNVAVPMGFESCTTDGPRAPIEGYVDWHYRRVASNATRGNPSICEDNDCRPIGTHLAAA